MAFRVRALRRYPVKSMGGEALDAAALDERGLAGDRWFAVRDADGRFASGKDTRRFRRRDAVFEYAALTGADGGVRVSRDGREWAVGDPGLDADLSERMGEAVRVLPESGVAHHDSAAVSLIGSATLEWCARRWGGAGDARRLRANIVIDVDEPFAEEAWIGRGLRIGSTALQVSERTPRCRMIDLAQDGVAPGAPWLTSLGRERELFLAVYASVRVPGRLSVGDEVLVG